MPGILPMKVIKVGSSAQARIAQACDRCRSKKIRCDGFRPCCTQCAQVGFECKTSDKLSRRAFPRGYTESLEERVRALEGEVRELKDLLDAKDEKLDLLSKVHSQSPHTSHVSPSSSSYSASPTSRRTTIESQNEFSDASRSSPPTSLSLRNGHELRYTGSSSGRALADGLKKKMRLSGKTEASFDADRLFSTEPPSTNQPKLEEGEANQAPPRMFSDQMINVYFQEWAPLFPIIHRPAFLRVYEQFVTDPQTVKESHSLAQLNLVFCVAASSVGLESPETEACERRWKSALRSILPEENLASLQTLALAQLHCIQKGDKALLQQYKAIALGTAQRLGLHQSQESLPLDTLSSEMRKRVFWSFYTVDAFSAAFTGLPRLITDADVACEFPTDIDDEYISPEGFEPSIPGESTRTSSALAIFGGARILSRCLNQLYSLTVDDVSVQKPLQLEAELNSWFNALPQHLKMAFVKDKPSTNIISSRCPLLALAYHYIRALVHRPAACAEAGQKRSSSSVALASSSKHIVQIIQLLEERTMSFSFCLNKDDLLVTAGLGLLCQISDLDKKSKLVIDSEAVLSSIMEMLGHSSVPDPMELKRACCPLVSSQTKFSTSDARPQQRSAISAANNVPSYWSVRKKELQNIALRYSQAARGLLPSENANKDGSRASLASVSVPFLPNNDTTRHFRPIAPSWNPQSPGASSFDSLTDGSVALPKAMPPPRIKNNASSRNLNLDYFSFSGYSTPATEAQQFPHRNSMPTLHDGADSDLEQLLSSMNQDSWPPVSDDTSILEDNKRNQDVKPNLQHSTSELYDLPADFFGANDQPKPQSNFSYSEESLTSGEEFSSLDAGSAGSDSALQAMMMQGPTPEDFVQADAEDQ